MIVFTLPLSLPPSFLLFPFGLFGLHLLSMTDGRGNAVANSAESQASIAPAETLKVKELLSLRSKSKGTLKLLGDKLNETNEVLWSKLKRTLKL